MSQKKKDKKSKYLASKIFALIGILSGIISALSAQWENLLIQKISVFLSQFCVFLLVLAMILGVLEILWRKFLKNHWDKLKSDCIKCFEEAIKKMLRIELKNIQDDLKKVYDNTEQLRERTSENHTTDVVKKNITEPVKRIQDEIVEIKDMMVPLNKSAEISKDIYIALSEENFKFLQTDATPLESFMKEHHDINKIRIICYGRNGYSKAFHYIDEHKKTINCEIVVYNIKGDKTISAPGDEDAILKQISSITKEKRNGARNVYLTNIIPTIRAAILYVNDQAVWASYEPYIFSMEDEKNILRRAGSADKNTLLIDGNKGEDEIYTDAYNGTLIVELDKMKTIKKDEFNKIVGCIEHEFARLKADSSRYK